MTDQRVGRPQDGLGAAVIAFELDDADFGKVLLEIEDVLDIRSAPAVDRLIGIAGHGQVGVIDRQRPHDRVLRQIGVLIFVDQDIAVAGVERAARFRTAAQQHGDVQQQIVEVDRVGPQQPLGIERIDPLDDVSQRMPAAGRVFGGRDQVVLGPAQGVGNAIGRVMGRVDAGLFQHSAEHLPAVGRVVDGEILAQPDQGRVLPQQPGTKPMKRAHPDRLAGGQSLDALPHFVGGLVGERQGQDLPGRDAVVQELGDAMGDDPGFSAARPGQDRAAPPRDVRPLRVGEESKNRAND